MTPQCRRSMIAAIALFSCNLAFGQAYKWIDENGRTHFSDVPPPDRKADKLTIRPQVPEDPQAAARQRDWQTQLQDSNLRNAQQQAQQEAAERDRAMMERNCSNARGELNMLQRGRVFRTGPNGERQYLEDNDRPAALSAAQEKVARYCR